MATRRYYVLDLTAGGTTENRTAILTSYGRQRELYIPPFNITPQINSGQITTSAFLPVSDRPSENVSIISRVERFSDSGASNDKVEVLTSGIIDIKAGPSGTSQGGLPSAVQISWTI